MSRKRTLMDSDDVLAKDSNNEEDDTDVKDDDDAEDGDYCGPKEEVDRVPETPSSDSSVSPAKVKKQSKKLTRRAPQPQWTDDEDTLALWSYKEFSIGLFDRYDIDAERLGDATPTSRGMTREKLNAFTRVKRRIRNRESAKISRDRRTAERDRLANELSIAKKALDTRIPVLEKRIESLTELVMSLQRERATAAISHSSAEESGGGSSVEIVSQQPTPDLPWSPVHITQGLETDHFPTAAASDWRLE
jgi:hypothetical protein